MEEVPTEVVELCKNGGTGLTQLVSQLTVWSKVVHQVSQEERRDILESVAWNN